MTTKLNLRFAALSTIVIGLAACQPTQRSAAVSGAELNGKAVDQGLANRGAVLFRNKGCDMCHGFGRTVSGPDLAGIMERRDPAWTKKWLQETNAMIEMDPQAQDMVKQWKGYKMPQIALQDRDVDALFHFFAQETARVRGSGSE
jgi:cytochrome c551/c552